MSASDEVRKMVKENKISGSDYSKPPEQSSFPQRVWMAIVGEECQIFPTLEMAKKYGPWESITAMVPDPETLVAAARAEAFEEAFDVVDRRRTQQEVMAGFGDACMKELSKRAVEARLPGKPVERPGEENG